MTQNYITCLVFQAGNILTSSADIDLFIINRLHYLLFRGDVKTVKAVVTDVRNLQLVFSHEMIFLKQKPSNAFQSFVFSCKNLFFDLRHETRGSSRVKRKPMT
jgi:hypothetical protein